MKRLFTSILAVCLLMNAYAQPGYSPSSENIRSREEFSSMRFGIFIHWGIYSMPARGEWALNSLNYRHDEYSRLAAGFCPSKFDASQWVDIFKSSGARYVTITSRHHDGFSMFGTKQSPYNIVDGTPFRRDVLKELSQACQEKDFRLHFYYSHVDWGREDYWPQGRTGHNTGRKPGDASSWKHYQDFMDAQLTELLTNYGPIGAIWFDGVWDFDEFPREKQPEIWGLYHQYELIHRLQPGCLVGNNHHLVPFAGEDIQIFERDVPGDNTAGYSGESGISSLPLETCQTMNGSWGYNIGDKNYKSVDELITLLVRTAGKGANLLLNIGPRPDGTIPDEAIERLSAMGEWMKINGDTIYDTLGGCVPEQSWGVTTQKGNTLFAHVLTDDRMVFIPIEGKKLKSATMHGSDTRVTYTQTKEGVILTMPSGLEGPDRIVDLVFKELL